MKKDFNLEIYQWKFTDELLDIDMSWCCVACCALLDMFPNTASYLNVFFTNECTIYCCTHDRNVMLWAKENLHFMVELEHNPPHLMWAGMTASHFSGPCFFIGHADATSYAEMLEALELRDRGLMENVWLEYNRAFAHFALTVCKILNEPYLGCWIGCGSPSLVLLSWPPHTPRLITPAHSLWGNIKRLVAVHHYCNSGGL
jgi:hypothetical protein